MTAAPSPLADRQIALLDELAVIGMDAARAIGRQITAAAPDEGPVSTEALAALEGLSRAYAKVARAIRLTLLLQDRIARPPLNQGDKTPAYEPITHIVRTIVDPNPERALRPDPRERFDREGFDREPLEDGLPAADLMAHICQDLGLDAEWSLMAAETWARGDTIRAAPGWPIRCEGDDDYGARSP